MQLWQKKIIRMWLVILLPVGFFLSYQAYTSHQTSLEMQRLGSEVLEGTQFQWDDSDKVSLIILSLHSDYPKEAKKYFQLRDESRRSRNIYAITSLIFICFPLITWLLLKTCRFVMYDQEQANKRFIKWLKYALCLALIVLFTAILYPFAVKKKEEAPVPSNYYNEPLKDKKKQDFESKGMRKLLDEFDREDTENARKLLEKEQKGVLKREK